MSATCKMILTTTFVAVLAAVSVQVSAYYTEAENDLMDIMKIIMKPRKPERFSTDVHFKNSEIVTGHLPKILQFSYQDCGSQADSLRIHNMKLTPDPLVLPGQIGVTFNLTNNRTATGPIQVQLTVEKKIVFWIELPCVDNVGSCTYSDICKMLPKSKSQCPPNLIKNHVPCTCPLPKGQYNLPVTKFNVGVKNVPAGDYKVKAQFKSREGPLACLNVMISLA